MPWGFAAAGVASGVAGAAASSAGSKKGSKQSDTSARLSDEQAKSAAMQRDAAMQQLALTQNLRRRTTGVFDQFLANGTTPGFLDLNEKVAPTTQLASLSTPGIMAEQAQQRKLLMNAGVRGGQLTQGLGQAAIQSGLQRANVLQGLQLDDIMRQEQRDAQRTGIRQNLFGAATDLGTGGLTQSQQGLGQAMTGYGIAAGNYNSLGAQRIQQNNQLYAGLGGIAGMGLGYGASQFLPAPGAMNPNKYGGTANYSGLGGARY